MKTLLLSDAKNSWLTYRRSLERRQRQRRLMVLIADWCLTHYGCHPGVSNEATSILHPSYLRTVSTQMSAHPHKNTHTNVHTPATNTLAQSSVLVSVLGQRGKESLFYCTNHWWLQPQCKKTPQTSRAETNKNNMLPWGHMAAYMCSNKMKLNKSIHGRTARAFYFYSAINSE